MKRTLHIGKHFSIAEIVRFSAVRIPGDLLNDGTHRVSIYLVEDQSVVLSKHEDILVFDVIEPPGERQGWFGKWEGAIRPRLQWSTELVNSGRPRP